MPQFVYASSGKINVQASMRAAIAGVEWFDLLQFHRDLEALGEPHPWTTLRAALYRACPGYVMFRQSRVAVSQVPGRNDQLVSDARAAMMQARSLNSPS